MKHNQFICFDGSVRTYDPLMLSANDGRRADDDGTTAALDLQCMRDLRTSYLFVGGCGH